MRTLIIDNYDSFTYNLFHLVGSVTGVEPTVVRNDEPGWALGDLGGYDNVIISPGPGRPDRDGDFGICGDVIRSATIPLLGVCLGHQGICQVHGGDVRPAPEVRHGLVSRVHHGRAGLFAGVPSPFEAVRYHSLAVGALPDVLEGIATAEDGVLMAVRHRSRPQWGVQFHPESVRTEHGHRLLANFLGTRGRITAGTRRPASPGARVGHGRLAVGVGVRDWRRWVAAGVDVGVRLWRRWVGLGVGVRLWCRWVASGVDARTRFWHRRVASEVNVEARLWHRRVVADVDAEAVFDALYRESAWAFWLDSAGGGRFSFLGDASGPLARVATADVAAREVTVRSALGDEVVHGSFLDWVDADLAANRVGAPELPFDFVLGWVGYLGYELKGECGAANAHRAEQPDAAMISPDRAVVVDHEERAVYLLALPHSENLVWLEETEGVVRRLRPVPDAPITAELGQPRARHDRTAYLRLIDECRREITAGETYEVCLTNQLVADGKLDPWPAYRLLRSHNPEPFAALLRLGERSVLSASPERFLRVTPDGIVESRPIKGTRPRGKSEVDDERLRHQLLTSVKDRAENLMIVDLVRNDLGVVAELGSVHVAELFAVELHPTVHQLVSTVRARLRADRTAVDCVRAAFPGGSMTGAPKPRTMKIIDRLEGGPRGVYSGALGYFSRNGAADFSIVIRTLVVEPDRVSYGVGGAIIALSSPDSEVAETAVKATPLLRLLDLEFPE